MTDEERVTALHEKMRTYRKKKDRRAAAICGAAGSMLLVCLLLLVGLGDGFHAGATAGKYSGAALLFDGIGGYVLIGVIAFIVGVGIAAFCIHRKNRNLEEAEGRKKIPDLPEGRQ